MERLVWKAVPGYDGYYEISTGKVFVFEGLREAERKMNLDHKSALNVIKGRCKHTKGYSISYA